jgi:hypothetical protein
MNDEELKEVLILRLQPKDILVLKTEEVIRVEQLQTLTKRLQEFLDFPVLVITLGANDNVGAIRYEDAKEKADGS